MKFLVIIEGVAAQPTMISEQSLAQIKDIWQWSRTLAEAGKSEAVFAFADEAGGLMGGCSIMNVDSLEELAENLGTCPAAGIATFKVHPLVAPELVERLVDKALSALANKK